MDKHQLTRLLARMSHRSRAKAADDVDTLVYRMIRELKRSHSQTSAARISAAESTAGKEKQ